MPRPKAKERRAKVASVRLTPSEWAEMEAASVARGFASLSEYVRHLHDEALKAEGSKGREPGVNPADFPFSKMRCHLATGLGQALHGDALCYLFGGAMPKSVDLIMTSPPFGLVRKKDYGNEDAHRYCDWFRPFAEGFRRVLKDNGSLVIDIGGAW